MHVDKIMAKVLLKKIENEEKYISDASCINNGHLEIIADLYEYEYEAGYNLPKKMIVKLLRDAEKRITEEMIREAKQAAQNILYKHINNETKTPLDMLARRLKEGDE